MLNPKKFIEKVKAFISENPKRAKFVGLLLITVTLPLIIVAALTVQNLIQKASEQNVVVRISDAGGNILSSTYDPNVFIDINLNAATGWVLPDQQSSYNNDGLVKSAYALGLGKSCRFSSQCDPGLKCGNFDNFDEEGFGQCISSIPTSYSTPVYSTPVYSTPSFPTSIPTPTAVPISKNAIYSRCLNECVDYGGTSCEQSCAPILSAPTLTPIPTPTPVYSTPSFPTSIPTPTAVPSYTPCANRCEKFDTKERRKACLQLCDSLPTSTSTPPKGCDELPTFQYQDKSYATGAEICLNGTFNENILNCNDAAKLLGGREKGQCVNALCYYCGAIITTPTPAPASNILRTIYIQNKDTDGSSGGSSPIEIAVNSGADIAHTPWKLNDLLPDQTQAPRIVEVTLLGDKATAPFLVTITLINQNSNIPVSPTVPVSPTINSIPKSTSSIPSATPSSFINYKNYDLNKDGVINCKDTMILVSQYKQKRANLSADFNHDGIVDGIDYNAIVRNYTPGDKTECARE